MKNIIFFGLLIISGEPNSECTKLKEESKDVTHQRPTSIYFSMKDRLKTPIQIHSAKPLDYTPLTPKMEDRNADFDNVLSERQKNIPDKDKTTPKTPVRILKEVCANFSLLLHFNLRFKE